MTLYHSIRLALAFTGIGVSIGLFLAHYYRTQQRSKTNQKRLDALEDDGEDGGGD